MHCRQRDRREVHQKVVAALFVQRFLRRHDLPKENDGACIPEIEPGPHHTVDAALGADLFDDEAPEAGDLFRLGAAAAPLLGKLDEALETDLRKLMNASVTCL